MYAVKEIIPISCACDFVCAAYDKCYTCDFGYTWYHSITFRKWAGVLNSNTSDDDYDYQTETDDETDDEEVTFL